MHVLGLPTYLAVMAIMLIAPTNFLINVGIGSGVVLVFQYVYCNSLSFFNNQNIGWRFVVLWGGAVLTIQALILGSVYMFAT